MDVNKIPGNERKWKYFLSSIKTFKKLPTNNVTINTKHDTKSLSTDFANKLLQKKGGTIKLTGTGDVLNKYKHLDIQNSEQISPHPGSDHQPNFMKSETWPKSKNRSIDIENSDSDNSERESNSRVLPFDTQGDPSPVLSDDDDSEISMKRYNDRKIGVDEVDEVSFAPSKKAQTSNITEASATNDSLNIGSVNTKVKHDSNETEKEATTSTEVAAEDFIHVNDTININRSRKRHSNTKPKKSDIDKACSSWKVQDIAKYFMFDECVTSIAVPDKTSSFSDDVYDLVLKDVNHRLATVKGADLAKRKRNSDSEMLVRLKSIISTETGSRLILDALLIPLCSALDIQIEVEKNIDCNFLPNCRFDYCLKKGHKIIGCVEAKSIKSLSERSVAQALLQLMILQTALIANEGDESLKDTPVFVIVTDGHRFIYIQLKGQYLGFEHDNEKLKIREIRNENDFKQIMDHISFLINGEH